MYPEELIPIVIADLHPIVRIGVRCLLKQTADLILLGEAAHAEEAVRLVEHLEPHVLLLGMNLPVTESLNVAEQVHEAALPVRILVWSALEEEHYVFEMLARGVSGYLTKGASPERLLSALRQVASGEKGLLSAPVAARLRPPQAPDAIGLISGLSRRENEVLSLLAQGYDNEHIAERLYLSPKTVKNHITSLYDKLGVGKRAEVVAWAWRHGLVQAP